MPRGALGAAAGPTLSASCRRRPGRSHRSGRRGLGPLESPAVTAQYPAGCWSSWTELAPKAGRTATLESGCRLIQCTCLSSAPGLGGPRLRSAGRRGRRGASHCIVGRAFGPDHLWEGNGQRGSCSDSETPRTWGVGEKNESFHWAPGRAVTAKQSVPAEVQKWWFPGVLSVASPPAEHKNKGQSRQAAGG